MGSTILDDDLDGKANRVVLDENEDKKPDAVGYDDNQDGEWDDLKKFLNLCFFNNFLGIFSIKILVFRQKYTCPINV